MSTITSVSTDSTNLPASVPWLETNGVNWPIFATRFEIAVVAKDKWGHFTGATSRPSYDIHPITEDQATEIHQWDKDEAVSRFLLSQRVHDGTLYLVRHATTVTEQWVEIVKYYTEKGAYAQTSLRQSFL
ncbi:hypothetical protein IW261DRAFT_1351159, partial [Armillaria novae-zelandiae]